MTAIAVLLGALTGAAAVAAVAAWRGFEAPPARRRREEPRWDRFGLRLGLAAVAGVVVGLATRWPVAALAGSLAGLAAPGLVSGRAVRQAESTRIEGIASWTEMLRDVMTAAGGLEQAILATAPVAPAAIRPQVQSLAGRLQSQRLPDALRVFADQLDDATGDLVVAALLLASERSPGRLSELLGSLADAARAEVGMRLRIEAGRARTRSSVRIITGCTAAFSLGLVLLNRPYLAAYDDLAGQGVLALVACCYACAYWWLERTSRSHRPARFLTTDTETPS